jgi:malate dehydrogenase (quinone)
MAQSFYANKSVPCKPLRVIDMNTSADVVLIGAGIMSATLGTLLRELDPKLTIEIYERMDGSATESSDAWNNAGTGHAAYCELNYTPELADGSIDISKAVKVSEAFELTKQFWAHMVETGELSCPTDFIKAIPHCAFVWGEENVQFLRKRWEAMRAVAFFKEMQYSEDHEVISQWMPLVMEGRNPSEVVAATKMDLGTDVDFGALTREMFARLMRMEGVKLHFGYEVRDIDKADDGGWEIRVKDLHTGNKKKVHTPFVFIGAGGGTLHLLQKADIPEGKDYGGFPVSGQWLRCINPAIIARHNAKVYGKAGVNAPPMSVPHLDTRRIAGQPALLFGPFAGFSTKFLKEGSLWDLPKSIRLSNLVPMVSAGWNNIPLTKYLIRQVMQSDEDRLSALREYYPAAKEEDWELEIAGQRVQVIKADEEEGGVLEFGTEVVASSDGSLAALLGASPGASTAVSIMIGLLERCFPTQMKEWRWKLKEMIPSYGRDLSEEPGMLDQIRTESSQTLGLTSFTPNC